MMTPKAKEIVEGGYPDPELISIKDPQVLIDEAWEYVEAVVSGEIQSSRYNKSFFKTLLERKDIELVDGGNTWVYRPRLAHKFLYFCQNIVLATGYATGKPYVPTPWQTLFFLSIFAFVDKNDNTIRQYKDINLMIARKNSKTTMAAIVVLYFLITTKQAMEVYGIATQKEQSKVLFNAAINLMRRLKSSVCGDLNENRTSIYSLESGAVFEYLSKETKGLDGRNAQVCVFDEASQIINTEAFTIMFSSQGTLTSPLNLYTTTASNIRENYYFEFLSECKDIALGVSPNKRIFPMIYAFEEEDTEDPENWIISNPNLGISVLGSFLQERVTEAKSLPSTRGETLTKHFNIYANIDQSWLTDLEVENMYLAEEPDLSGRRCMIGIDLSQGIDPSAMTLVVCPGEDGKYYMKTICFMPSESYDQVPKHLAAMYTAARNSGHLVVNDGSVVDYLAIAAKAREWFEQYSPEAVQFDAFHSGIVISELEKNYIPCVKVPQTIMSLAEPTGNLKRLIKTSRIEHSQPFFSWQLRNCSAYCDLNGNEKVKKPSIHAKVDSVLAAIFALKGLGFEEGYKPKPYFGIAKNGKMHYPGDNK